MVIIQWVRVVQTYLALEICFLFTIVPEEISNWGITEGITGIRNDITGNTMKKED